MFIIPQFKRTEIKLLQISWFSKNCLNKNCCRQRCGVGSFSLSRIFNSPGVGSGKKLTTPNSWSLSLPEPTVYYVYWVYIGIAELDGKLSDSDFDSWWGLHLRYCIYYTVSLIDGDLRSRFFYSRLRDISDSSTLRLQHIIRIFY